MTKLLLFISFLFTLTSCNRNITGTYKHKICSVGPNCFIIIFDKDSSFEYKYFQDVLDSGTIKGKYTYHDDTIQLMVAKDSAEITPYFKTYSSADTNLLVKVFISFGHQEQANFGGQIILNDTTKLKLDLDGQVKHNKMEINKVKVIS